jgi:hypothetical protein
MDGPAAGDLVIRALARSEFGVFVVTVDRGEHPLRAFPSYADALHRATHVAEEAHVEVCHASSQVSRE